MFGIGSTELLVILVVALLVLGPKNLPKIAQTLGRAMGEFRKVSTEFQRTLNTEIAFEEEAKKHAEAEKELEAAKAAKQAEASAAAPAAEAGTASEMASSVIPSEPITTATTEAGSSAQTGHAPAEKPQTPGEDKA